MEPPPTVTVGTLLGKYRVTRAMGEGGMALVFEGEHVKLQQRVAIKILREEFSFNAEFVERFEREGRALAKLRTKHVVRVLDVDVTPGGAPYLVMELLTGRDLELELSARGTIPVGEALRYMRDAAAAIGEAHELGIVHRDLKPSNVFLAEEDGARVTKVIDFGIAKNEDAPEAGRLTRAEAVMGTPLYMAPEQFRRTRDVDARADVWALGATLYELLVGAPPFTGTATTIGVSVVTDAAPPIPLGRTDVTPEIRALLARCLEKDREKRFANGRELARELAALLPPEARAAMNSGSFVVAPVSSSAIALDQRDAHVADTQIAVTHSAPATTEVDPPQPPQPRSKRTAVVIGGALGLISLAAMIGGGAVFRPKINGEGRAPESSRSMAPSADLARSATPSPSSVATPTTPSAVASVVASGAPSLPGAAPRTEKSSSPKPQPSHTPQETKSSAPTGSQAPLFYPGQ